MLTNHIQDWHLHQMRKLTNAFIPQVAEHVYNWHYDMFDMYYMLQNS